MNVVLIGAELEENLGLRYMASSLKQQGHTATIIPFNEHSDISNIVRRVATLGADIIGLSMVFTCRAKEFCRLAKALREGGFTGHITAGGHFAALNCLQILKDFPEFDSIALGEGEELICNLANKLHELSELEGFCFRLSDGTPRVNPSHGNPGNLDLLPFPHRDTFHEYFGKPIASILSSRGCWRSCAFCSIDAWYRSGGGPKFRIRSISNVVAEMKELYYKHGIRIFNFQDDNFFLPNCEQTLARFKEMREQLFREGMKEIAIAVKARPDSIHPEEINVLVELGIFRVFLGVENASDRALANLNRKCTREQIEIALRILNDFDIHIAYNLLMFEPETTMDDIMINLRFIERHMDNPFNFCRAEAYAGTWLEEKLRNEEILLGDYFGFDYRIKDPKVEAFHRIANYAFFDRNFSNFGLHYFNMEIDFSFHLLKRFYPEILTQEMRGEVHSFIKETNIDTYRCLCLIYDIVVAIDPHDEKTIRGAMVSMRQRVDREGLTLRKRGERILESLRRAYAERESVGRKLSFCNEIASIPVLESDLFPYGGKEGCNASQALERLGIFGILKQPIPYSEFRKKLDHPG